MTEKTGSVLVVDDHPDVVVALKLYLKRHVACVDTTQDPKQLPRILERQSYDVVLLDMNFRRSARDGEEGFDWLRYIVKTSPQTVVILITAHGDVEMAVRAMKEGATDFVLKPWVNQKLLATVKAGIQLKHSKDQVQHLERVQASLNSEGQSKPQIWGDSAAMETIRTTIQKVGPTDAAILILGENGTGKDLLARSIHANSKRAGKPFVTVDMGAISESVFESELFGHVKGAFTDAKQDHMGRFEVAQGGTLFLDEVGNLPLSLQAKLLTVLQRKEIVPVGGNRPRQIDIRLVCATNMPLYQMAEQGEFRRDLLYRMNTLEIAVPPLRERPEDIPVLAANFLDLKAAKYGKCGLQLSPGALQKLYNYHWPGNVRELQHVMERVAILCETDQVAADDLLLGDKRHPQPTGTLVEPETYNLEVLEKDAISKALRKHSGNVSRAAKELGLTRATLYRKMEKYEL